MKKNEEIKKYPLVIMAILMVLLFILSIAIIGTSGTINSKIEKLSIFKSKGNIFSYNYKNISATFSLEVILFVIFILLFLYYLLKEEDPIIEKIMICILMSCEFLYLINCVLISSYLTQFKLFIEIDNALGSNIIGNYIGLTCSCFIFLVIILFFDLLLLNLYHYLFCNTGNFLFSFVKWFIDTFCNGFSKSENAEKLETENIDKKKQIQNLTEKLKHLLNMKFNIEIKNKKEEIMNKIY